MTPIKRRPRDCSAALHGLEPCQFFGGGGGAHFRFSVIDAMVQCLFRRHVHTKKRERDGFSAHCTWTCKLFLSAVHVCTEIIVVLHTNAVLCVYALRFGKMRDSFDIIN
jgi:hypothetical protein